MARQHPDTALEPAKVPASGQEMADAINGGAKTLGDADIRLLAARAVRLPISGSKPIAPAASDQLRTGATTLRTHSETYIRPVDSYPPNIDAKMCR